MMTQSTKRGNQLSADDQKYALAAYIYRNTIENERADPGAVKLAGGALPTITDSQWLSITNFKVTKSGRLDRRVHSCFTNHHEIPAWKSILDKFNP
jgi:hypothetical protein